MKKIWKSYCLKKSFGLVRQSGGGGAREESAVAEERNITEALLRPLAMSRGPGRVAKGQVPG